MQFSPAATGEVRQWPDWGLKGIGISYRDRGLQNGKIGGLNPFVPSLQNKVKLFVPPPLFLEVETF